MKCPSCGSENVTISLEETGTKTNRWSHEQHGQRDDSGRDARNVEPCMEESKGNREKRGGQRESLPLPELRKLLDNQVILR